MSTNSYNLRNRIMGAYMGAAAGDALGGPVECLHYRAIQSAFGFVRRFLPYTRPLKPGYALSDSPGSITDDTFIRDDFARFVLAYPVEAERTPEQLATFMVEQAHFEHWWPPAIEPVRKLASGEMTVAQTRQLLVGGGAGWWTPFGLLHAGDPEAAYEEVHRLSALYRQPFEQNLIAAAQAGVAASVLPGATVESVAETIMQYAGPLARKLLDRTRAIAQRYQGDWEAFAAAIYAEALVSDVLTELDGEIPAPAKAEDPYWGLTWMWAEQIPLAFGAFVFGQGDFVETLAASVNLGRDADSISTTCGTWIGGLVGLSGMPAEWLDAMQQANLRHIDLLQRASQIAAGAGTRHA